MYDKKLLRKKYLNLRKNTEPLYEKEILGIFLENNLSEYSNIMSYNPIDNEFNVRDLNTYLLNKKNIFVPIINEKNIIVPCKYTNTNILGKYRIEEPLIKAIGDISEIDICLVPGIVFDYFGNRIGYGKGYYDRLLKNKDIIKVGCCYTYQLIDEIDNEIFDIKMDYIFTERGIIKCY